MSIKGLAKELAGELGFSWTEGSDRLYEEHLTESTRQVFLYIIAKAQTEALAVLSEQHKEAQQPGPDNTRAEVTGMSTTGKNKNFSNTGFGGGPMMRLVAV